MEKNQQNSLSELSSDEYELDEFHEKKKEMEDELKNKMEESMTEILSEVYTSR